MGQVSFELPAAGTYTVTAELNGQTVEQTVEVTENGQTTVLPISFPPQYTITLLVDPAGGGTVSGGGTVTEGQSVTVTAAASPDYTFSSWMENGAAVSTSATYTFTASADRTLTAVFAAAVKRFTVTTAIDPPGAGSATGAGMYDEGASVTVAASPGDGYQFSAWQEGGQTISSSPSYTFTVSANRALTAVFAVIPVYTITASIDPDGSGTVTGAGQYQEGQTVTLVAAPADGYEFTGWKENGETASTDTTYSFTATADRTLTAAFGPSSRLPDGYTEVEYIESPISSGNGSTGSNGKCYINTGVMLTSTTKIVMEESGLLSNSNTTRHNFLGVYQSSSSRLDFVQNQSYIYFGIGSSSSKKVATYYRNSRCKITCDIPNKSVSVNGAKVSISTSIIPSGNIYLLSNGMVQSRSINAARIYSCQIYQNNVPIKDFVPCTNPDQIAGLYDLIDGTFYPSASSYPFNTPS